MSVKELEENLEFRKIPSLNFLYEVNCDGTKFRNVRTKRCLKCYIHPCRTKAGYLEAVVPIDGKRLHVLIHQVVAECWIGKKPKGYEVDHIDRNSLNNHFSNLRYVTHKKNMQNRDYPHSVPVRLIRGKKIFDFPTSRQAAKFLARAYPSRTEKNFALKLHYRQKKIFDYEVNYLKTEEKKE